MLHLRITGSGPPVLLLHGAPSSVEDFRPVVEALGRRHRFLWPDLPGYGLSEPVDGRTTVSRVQTILEDAVLSLGIKELAIVAFSFGAYRALSLALNGRLRVTELVLLSPLASVNAQEAEALRNNAAIFRAHQTFADDGLRGAFADRMLSPEARGQELAVKQVTAWLDLTKPSLLADEWDAMADARDLLPHVGLLRARVTLRHGAADGFFSPQQSEELAKRIKGSRLQRVPEVGHALLVEDPHRTLDAIDEALRAQLAARREQE